MDRFFLVLVIDHTLEREYIHAKAPTMLLLKRSKPSVPYRTRGRPKPCQQKSVAEPKYTSPVTLQPFLCKPAFASASTTPSTNIFTAASLASLVIRSCRNSFVSTP